MKEIPVLILCAVLVVGTGACSSTSPSSDAERADVNRANNPANAVTDAGNTNAIPGGSTSPNEQQTFDSVLAARKAKIDAMRNSGETVPDPGLPETLPTRPAPDNSEFSAVLTDFGRETRTFKDHPQLLKVEKLILVNRQTIKIYLRNGKIIQLPGEKVPILATAPAAEILRAAGIQTPSSAPRSTGSDSKNSEKSKSTKNEK